MAELNGIARAQSYASSAEQLQRWSRTIRGDLDQLAANGASAGFQDSFQNFLLQLGVGAGAAVFDGSTYGFNPITRIRTLLEWIHRGSWLGGVAVDLVADDMTKMGIEFTSDLDEDDEQEINNEFIRLNIWESLGDCERWARLYGGALGIIMVDGQDWSEPLDIDRIAPGAFRGILAMDRWMVEPTLQTLVTELGPDVGLPKYYKITGFAPIRQGQLVHYSRCIRFEGIRLPYWQRVSEQLWGISVIERLYDRMVAFDSATTGAAQALQRFHLRTYKITGLKAFQGQGGDAELKLLRYVDMMRRFQGIEGMTLIDAEDDFEVSSTGAFAGIPDALLQLGQQIAGSLQIPLVRLFGMSPAGLSATGESDLRMWYDNVHQMQERDFRIPVQKIIRLVAMSKRIVNLGKDVQWIFRPLWQLTEEGKTAVASSNTAAINQSFAEGIITHGQALGELRQLARKTGLWTTITPEAVKQAEEEPPPAFGEVPEMQGEGEGFGGTQPRGLRPPHPRQLLEGAGQLEEGAGSAHSTRSQESDEGDRPRAAGAVTHRHWHLYDRMRNVFRRRAASDAGQVARSAAVIDFEKARHHERERPTTARPPDYDAA